MYVANPENSESIKALMLRIILVRRPENKCVNNYVQLLSANVRYFLYLPSSTPEIKFLRNTFVTDLAEAKKDSPVMPARMTVSLLMAPTIISMNFKQPKMAPNTILLAFNRCHIPLC
jgi:hypothetical protein